MGSIKTSQTAVFKQNLAALMKRNRELAEQVSQHQINADYTVLHSKTGLPIPKVNGRTLHSTYDPEAEGRLWASKNLDAGQPAENETLVIFGLGFAYHIRPLIGIVKRCVVLEPSIDTLVLAMHQVDLSNIFTSMSVWVGSRERLEACRPYAIWEHGPTVSVDCTTFSPRDKTTPARGGHSRPLADDRALKIMVVGPIYGGSLPIAGYCVEALSNLGHDAELWDASIFYEPFQKVLDYNLDDANKKVLYDLFLHLISEMVVASCTEQKPDLVLALAQAPLSTEALQRFKENQIATAYWFVEDFLLMPYWKQYARHYDVYFTIQDGLFFEELARAGAIKSHYLPLAASPSRHCPLMLTAEEAAHFGSEISFMGAGYHNRREMFKGLLSYDLKLWGTGWDPKSMLWSCVQNDSKRISTGDAVKIYNASKINLNLHSSVRHEGVNPSGDFLNPRTYEIAACGGFQLTDQRSKMSAHFEIGSEMICFEDAEQLTSLIDYYKNRPEKRKAVAEKARQRVLSEHTYERRMAELIEVMLQAKPECFRKQSSRPLSISNIESFCETHPETVSILKEFNGSVGGVSIDDVARSIKSKPGDIRYHEAIFLLMKEFNDHFTGMRC